LLKGSMLVRIVLILHSGLYNVRKLELQYENMKKNALKESRKNTQPNTTQQISYLQSVVL